MTWTSYYSLLFKVRWFVQSRYGTIQYQHLKYHHTPSFMQILATKFIEVLV